MIIRPKLNVHIRKKSHNNIMNFTSYFKKIFKKEKKQPKLDDKPLENA